MANGFYWKPTVGPLEQRPGHWNGMWQYWSTDGEPPAFWHADCQQGGLIWRRNPHNPILPSASQLLRCHCQEAAGPCAS